MVLCKFINWFEAYINYEAYIVGKLRIVTDDTRYIVFPKRYYSFMTPDEYMKNMYCHVSSLDIGVVRVIRDNSPLIYTFANIDEAPAEAEDIRRQMFIVESSRQIKNLLCDNISDSMTWFFVLYDIDPIGVYDIDIQHMITPHDLRSKNIRAHAIPISNIDAINNILRKTTETFVPGYNVLSFDIETWNSGKMSCPENCPISHIGLDFYNKQKPNSCWKSNLVVIDMPTAPLHTTTPTLTAQDLQCCQDIISMLRSRNGEIIFLTEEVMLTLFCMLVGSDDVDVMLTYNGNKFDYQYVISRASKYRKTIKDPSGKPLKLEGAFYKGIPESKRIVRGMSIIYFDLFIFYKVEQSHASYSLRDISASKFNHMFEISGNVITATGVTPLFNEILGTSNYVLIKHHYYRILTYTVSGDRTEIVLEKKVSINESRYNVSLTKDNIEIFDKNAYSNYSEEKAVSIGMYCLHDAALCRYLFEYELLENTMEARSSRFKLPMFSCYARGNSRYVQGILLNKIISTKTLIERSICKIEDDEFQGGFVLKPREARSNEYTLVFDFLSLYPTVFITFNLSPEMITAVFVFNHKNDLEEIKKLVLGKYPSERFVVVPILKEFNSMLIVYDRSKKGIIPQLLADGIEERKRYKKLMQNAPTQHLRNYYNSMQLTTKIFINSIYGLMGSKYFAFYSKLVAQSCTSIGRELLQFMINLLDGTVIKNGEYSTNEALLIYTNQVVGPFSVRIDGIDGVVVKVVYGDTDSVMFTLEHSNHYSEEQIRLVGKKMEACLNENALQNIGVIEFEDVFRKMFFVAKKKYYGIRPDMSKYYKGISLVRRDNCYLHKHIISNVIDMIFDEKDIRSINDYVNSEYNKQKSLTRETIDLSNYVISAEYRPKYKTEHNVSKAVVKYNNSHEDQIEYSDRFYYAITTAGSGFYESLEAFTSPDSIPSHPINIKEYFKRIVTEIEGFLPAGETICIDNEQQQQYMILKKK